ncbi:MAG: VWA domain-containing protein [Pyrinomonadaceae bacterium]
MQRLLLLVLVVAGFGLVTVRTQTPETPEKVETEEIKINVAAVGRDGEFVSDLKKEDLVVTEDGRLHQLNSLTFTPASVMIALDNGGVLREKKNINTTREIAGSIVRNLREDSSISLMQFHDGAEILSGWSKDRPELLNIINNRTRFGRRSSFTQAIAAAAKYFKETPVANPHLILVTDGLDSPVNSEERAAALRELWQSGIVVHVISWTLMENAGARTHDRVWRKGEQEPKRMPEEMLEQLALAIPVKRNVAKELLKNIYSPRLFSIVTDGPFIHSQREHKRALGINQIQLSVLAGHTGGDFLLPGSLTEIVENAAAVSRSINQQYVATYSPKRPLKDVKEDEIRSIEITSRRSDVDIRSSRKLVVFAPKTP